MILFSNIVYMTKKWLRTLKTCGIHLVLANDTCLKLKFDHPSLIEILICLMWSSSKCNHCLLGSVSQSDEPKYSIVGLCQCCYGKYNMRYRTQPSTKQVAGNNSELVTVWCLPIRVIRWRSWEGWQQWAYIYNPDCHSRCLHFMHTSQALVQFQSHI